MIQNETLQTILSRRSIRAYREQQITPEQLETILQAARFAPSGSNRQSWQFTVFQNPALLQELNELVRTGFSLLPASADEYPARAAARERAKSPDYCCYFHAPTLIVVSNRKDSPNAMADCACALENIFLAAHSLGLGSCWVNQLTWLREDAGLLAFLQRHGMPQDHRVCGSAAIGIPACAAPKAAPRREHTVVLVP